jgi:hypothetical protein
MESLLLSCGALSSPTMCRFMPALSDPTLERRHTVWIILGCRARIRGREFGLDLADYV